MMVQIHYSITTILVSEFLMIISQDKKMMCHIRCAAAAWLLKFGANQQMDALLQRG